MNVDAIFAMEIGADATRFMQQYSNFGLKGKIPLLGAQNFTDQSVIRTLGAECEGIVSSAHFAEGSDNPDDPEIRQGLYREVRQAAVALRLLALFGRDVGGQVDREDQGRHLEPGRLHRCGAEERACNSPLGRPVRLDDYGNPIYDVYIRKVEKNADGKFWNVPIETYPNVSQFWTYEPEEYLKQPPFSRDFQGIKK